MGPDRHMSAMTIEARRGGKEPLHLELRVAESCLMWIMGIELGSFARLVHALKH